MTKAERVSIANEFLRAIASCGRKFFAYQHDGEPAPRIAWIEMDGAGKLWLHNEWNGRRIYISGGGPWRGFHHGGTLRSLIEGLVRWIKGGRPLNPKFFSDHWAYGDAIHYVVDSGKRLGCIDAPSCVVA